MCVCVSNVECNVCRLYVFTRFFFRWNNFLFYVQFHFQLSRAVYVAHANRLILKAKKKKQTCNRNERNMWKNDRMRDRKVAKKSES